MAFARKPGLTGIFAHGAGLEDAVLSRGQQFVPGVASGVEYGEYQISNAVYFIKGSPLWNQAIRGASGYFGEVKHSQGGIRNPQEVEIPAGSYLLRVYDPKDGLRGVHGPWWSSLYDMGLIFDYFDSFRTASEVDGALTTNTSNPVDQERNNGILNGVFAIRREWSSYSQKQLKAMVVLRFRVPVKAFYGEGANSRGANNPNSIQDAEPIMLPGGERWIPRQIFLPNFSSYGSKVTTEIFKGETNLHLRQQMELYRSHRLPFEVLFPSNTRDYQAEADKVFEEAQRSLRRSQPVRSAKTRPSPAPTLRN